MDDGGFDQRTDSPLGVVSCMLIFFLVLHVSDFSLHSSAMYENFNFLKLQFSYAKRTVNEVESLLR